MPLFTKMTLTYIVEENVEYALIMVDVDPKIGLSQVFVNNCMRIKKQWMQMKQPSIRENW